VSLKQIFKKTPGHKGASEDHWIPLSDLMMGMMMVFLLVAVLFMNSLKEEQKKIEDDALDKNKLAQKYAQIAKDAEIQAQKAKEAQEEGVYGYEL
jgi:flagellar motor protein MotB